jgi:hypothetical protein
VATTSPASAPLTFQQELIWSIIQKNHSASHRTAYALRLVGALHVEFLRGSLDAAVRRHASLRTRIIVVDGVPQQVIDEPAAYRLPIVNCAADALESDPDADARYFVGKFLAQRVDLAAGPLFDVKLFRLSDREHVLAIVVHHIISDHMSDVLLFKELWSSYESLVSGARTLLADIPLQYRDYAGWQSSTRPRWMAQHGSYWKQKLAGAVPIQMPIDGGLESVQPHSTAELRMSFDEPLSSALHDLARRQRTMPALILVALYAALVSRWCRQNSFVIPFAVSGRHFPEHLNVIGSFAHLLFLRVELTGHETFLDLLKLITAEFFSAWRHLDHGKVCRDAPELTHGTLWEWLSWCPSELRGTYTPSEWNGRSDLPAVDSFSVKNATAEERRQESEIALYFWNSPEGIRGHGHYRADLFTPGTIDRFLRALRLLGAHVARDPLAHVASFQTCDPY